LIRFRNTHPAFAGEFRLLASPDHQIHIEWRNDDQWARLEVDLKATVATVFHSGTGAECRFSVAPDSIKEIAR